MGRASSPSRPIGPIDPSSAPPLALAAGPLLYALLRPSAVVSFVVVIGVALAVPSAEPDWSKGSLLGASASPRRWPAARCAAVPQHCLRSHGVRRPLAFPAPPLPVFCLRRVPDSFCLPIENGVARHTHSAAPFGCKQT